MNEMNCSAVPMNPSSLHEQAADLMESMRALNEKLYRLSAIIVGPEPVPKKEMPTVDSMISCLRAINEEVGRAHEIATRLESVL